MAISTGTTFTYRRTTVSGVPRIAQLIRQQRRRYAGTVLRTLARTQRGRPTPQVVQVLREALRASGIRLSPTSLHHLAGEITAGRPVELP